MPKTKDIECMLSAQFFLWSCPSCFVKCLLGIWQLHGDPVSQRHWVTTGRVLCQLLSSPVKVHTPLILICLLRSEPCAFRAHSLALRRQDAAPLVLDIVCRAIHFAEAKFQAVGHLPGRTATLPQCRDSSRVTACTGSLAGG